MAESISAYYPFVEDIRSDYRSLRRRGVSRAEAIDALRERYADELPDGDDGPVVRIALAMALCRRNELTEPVLADALAGIAELRRNEEENRPYFTMLRHTEAYVTDPKHLGPEAVFRARKPYIPQWQIGDTFAYRLTHKAAERAGVCGWYALLRKVEEFVDQDDAHRQIFYVTLCPPDALPKTGAELERLGYLRMMPAGKERWEYLAQIVPEGKKYIESYGLTKIGAFLDVPGPKNQGKENPLTAMPLFGILKRQGVWMTYPCFEEQLCDIYRSNGIEKPE